MDLDRTPSAIGYAAAEEVRALNHATLPPNAFGEAAQVAETLTAVSHILDRLPQALKQAAAGLRAMDEQQAIRMTDGTDPSEQVGVVLRALLNAEQGLGLARDAMRQAGPVANMYGAFRSEGLETNDARL